METAGKPRITRVRQPSVRTDPVHEAIARRLSGIEGVPPLEQARMIGRAARAGARALRGGAA